MEATPQKLGAPVQPGQVPDKPGNVQPEQPGETPATPGETPGTPAVPNRDAATVSSPLAKALLKGDLSDYVLPLDDAGYRDLRDLGDTQTAVTKAIKDAVPKARPGDVSRIIALWKSASATPGAALPIPKLPAGTKIDLTVKEVSFDDVTFKIPETFKVEKSNKDYVLGVDLTQLQWMGIAKRERMMYGINLEQAYASDSNAEAEECALLWKVPEGDEYRDVSTREADARSFLSFTSEQSNFHHHQLVDVAVSGSSPFVAVSAEVRRKEEVARSQSRKSMRMLGTYHYLYGELVLKHCTAPSPRLLERIDAALAKNDEESRFEALRSVFRTFGHVVPARLAVGGALRFESSKEMTGEVNEKQVELVVNAAVDAKAKGYGASAKTGFEDATHTMISAQSLVEETRFTAIGGNHALATDPKSWVPTTGDPNQWAVIQRKGLTPLVEWLDDTRKEAVTQAWTTGLRRMWNGGPVPDGYLFPDFEGRPITFSTGPKSEILAPSHVAGDLVRLAPQQDGAEAIASGVTWVLRYSRRTTSGDGRGQPLYQILEHLDEGLIAARAREITATTQKNKAIKDATGGMGPQAPLPAPRVALAAVQRSGKWCAGCVDVTGLAEIGAATLSSDDKDALWTIIPVAVADESGQLSATYALRNFGRGLQLGPVRSSRDLSDDDTERRTVVLSSPPKTPEDSGATIWGARTYEPRSAH